MESLTEMDESSGIIKPYGTDQAIEILDSTSFCIHMEKRHETQADNKHLKLLWPSSFD